MAFYGGNERQRRVLAVGTLLVASLSQIIHGSNTTLSDGLLISLSFALSPMLSDPATLLSLLPIWRQLSRGSLRLRPRCPYCFVVLVVAAMIWLCVKQ